MKNTVLQSNLAAALSKVLKAISPRAPLPILGNVLLCAKNGRMSLTGSDLQMSVTVWIDAKVERDGEITLPAKTFSDLVGRLSKDMVSLELDSATNTVSLRCGSTSAQIKGIAAAKYPPVKTSDVKGITLPGHQFKQIMGHVGFAAAKEDNRPALTCVNTIIEGGCITMATADGYCLAVRSQPLDEVYAGKAEANIPAKSMIEVAGMIDETLPLSISLVNNQNIVSFRQGDRDLPILEISSQIVEGRFPAYGMIIPTKQVVECTANREDWLKKARTAEIFARDDAFSGRVVIEPPTMPGMTGMLKMVGRSAERGDSSAPLEAEVKGESLDVHFDIRFIIDILDHAEEEHMVFTSNGKDSPGVWRGLGRDNLIYVVMPMNRG